MSAIAIVSGAGRGIGAATAQRLAADGMSVAVVDLDEAAARSSADRIRQLGGVAAPYACDVADESSVRRLIGGIASELGSPTVLVNNAGITRDNLLFKMPLQDWNAVVDVHLKGTFLMCRAAQKSMVDAGWGRIVNVSSTSALGNRGQSNYSAAKAGIQGLTKTMALELGKFGVTVNCVAPGFIISDMTRATAKRLGQDWDDYLAERVEQIPVGSAGTAEDVASAVSYFASPETRYVSGQVLYVAGGPRG